MNTEIHLIRQHAKPFASVDDFCSVFPHLDSFGDARVVLIGDASHGTSEFYTARAALTRHLIEHHGFNVVAVEADWTDAEAVDRYVRQRPGVQANVETAEATRNSGREPAFERFPTWMWRNLEVHNFVEWLRIWNASVNTAVAGSTIVGFYGLDLYSLGPSMRAVIGYLDKVDQSMADLTRARYRRLMIWAEDPHNYGLEALSAGFAGCERDVAQVLADLLSKSAEYSVMRRDGDEYHSCVQNACLVVDAERYYRAMFHQRDEGWNLRDKHMFETLTRILKHRGPASKAVVWAHNSHVGDARATITGRSAGELNIGQLCKETLGPHHALAIGCCTHDGTVAAADRWDADMRVMAVKPGLPGSYEELFHHTGIDNFLLDLRPGWCPGDLRLLLARRRLERFIGVIYKPRIERYAHYQTAILPEQFDAIVWFDKTRHVAALEVHQPHMAEEYDETWPFGV